MNKEARITPQELRALTQVMLDMGIIDMASGDTRIVLSSARVALPPELPLQPVEKHEHTETEEEADALMYASVV